jgi:hypothetical protein
MYTVWETNGILLKNDGNEGLEIPNVQANIAAVEKKQFELILS